MRSSRSHSTPTGRTRTSFGRPGFRASRANSNDLNMRIFDPGFHWRVLYNSVPGTISKSASHDMWLALFRKACNNKTWKPDDVVLVK